MKWIILYSMLVNLNPTIPMFESLQYKKPEQKIYHKIKVNFKLAADQDQVANILNQDGGIQDEISNLESDPIDNVGSILKYNLSINYYAKKYKFFAGNQTIMTGDRMNYFGLKINF